MSLVENQKSWVPQNCFSVIWAFFDQNNIVDVQVVLMLKCIVAITPLLPKSNLYKDSISLLDPRKGWCNIMLEKATCWWKCKYWMNMSKILWEIRHNLLRVGWKEVRKNVKRDKHIARSMIINVLVARGPKPIIISICQIVGFLHLKRVWSFFYC